MKETEPEADQDGYYQTTLPAIVFQVPGLRLPRCTQLLPAERTCFSLKLRSRGSDLPSSFTHGRKT